MSQKIIDSLTNIIDNEQVKTVFQPIISLRDGRVLGHEALSRITCEGEIDNPSLLFEVATHYNRLWEVEMLCRKTALDAAYRFMVPPYSKKLFLNVNPNIMHDDAFSKGFTKSFLKQFNLTSNNVIFEITERNMITDFDSFQSTMTHYKNQNFKIAIDDAGAGYSGLNLISEINPHYIKLDKQLIRGIDQDNIKYAIVKGMVEVTKITNIALIAEGIETIGELEALIDLGVHYGQGYLIQRPAEAILDIEERLVTKIIETNQKKHVLNPSALPHMQIEHICSLTDTVSPYEKVAVIQAFFAAHPNHVGLSVVEGDVPVGIVTPEKLGVKLSSMYGYTLYQNKPISEVMDRSFLRVDSNLSISEVSAVAMARPNHQLYDFIVVTKADDYIGTVTIKDLLQKSMEIEITSAKHQNPLSGLPGNLIVEQQLEQFVLNSQAASVAYIDIDHFKAFNDCYGFENGDRVIRFLATLLKKTFPHQFIGHVGGDDFVVALDEAVTASYFHTLTQQFKDQAELFYSDIDQLNGCLIGQDRCGDRQTFPLMTITCVVVNNRDHSFTNIYDLTEYLAELKHQAKTEKFRSVQ